MSDPKPDVDLGVLTRVPTVAKSKPRRLVRLVPILLLLGFAAVLLSTMSDLWRGALHVRVVRPQLAAGAGGRAASAISGTAVGKYASNHSSRSDPAGCCPPRPRSGSPARCNHFAAGSDQSR